MGQLLDKEVGGIKMKIGVIISNTDPELVWSALRFTNTAMSKMLMHFPARDCDRVFIV
jgi:hypothetical protein